MSFDLRIDEVDPDHWPRWRGVRLRALADTPEAFGSSLADWRDAPAARWQARLQDVPFNVLAVVDGHDVGQASGGSLDPGGGVELFSMWVAPEARGSGIGMALIAAVADDALRRGGHTLRLSVRRHNAAAIGLYRRAGFVTVDGPGDGDEDEDEDVMVKDLGAAPPTGGVRPDRDVRPPR